jgi:hypothetical protein
VLLAAVLGLGVLRAAADNPNDEQISPTVTISMSGTSVSSEGTLQYFANGNGYCTGSHYFNDHVAEHSFSQVTSYSGTITTSGTNCYRASVEATGVFGTSQRVTSGQVCYQPPPPPPPLYGIGCPTDPCDPLILDLNGDGVRTTGAGQPVQFDLDGDGIRERIAWTDPSTEEGFLYLDLDHKGRVEDGRELFGVGTVMPDGSRGHDGFEALSMYDSVAYGGNADRIIDSNDDVWTRLRLWIDRNHNGVCEPTETGPIHKYHVDSIRLDATKAATRDDAGNLHQFASTFNRLLTGRTDARARDFAIDAVAFLRLP